MRINTAVKNNCTTEFWNIFLGAIGNRRTLLPHVHARSPASVIIIIIRQDGVKWFVHHPEADGNIVARGEGAIARACEPCKGEVYTVASACARAGMVRGRYVTIQGKRKII